MQSVRYADGTIYRLAESNDLVVVRTNDRSLPSEADAVTNAAALSSDAREVLAQFDVRARFPEAGVEVFRAQRTREKKKLRDEARRVLKKEPVVQFAGRVLQDPKSKDPVLYTENLFVKFDPKQSSAACKKALKKAGLTIKRPLDYATNAYFVEAAQGIGSEVFEVALDLLERDGIEMCHPELVREARRRVAFNPQWHLKRMTIGGQAVNAHASVEAAWATSEGEGVVIAVIDDGVDIDHEEFSSPGKIVAPLNASVPVTSPNRANPRPLPGDNHGTACAGVACADGRHGASGVAPKARLMPIRLASALGSQAEADAFVHAAQNGADVISCSWGPTDGRWFDPGDPLHNHNVPLPDSTRLAIEFATTNGRGGAGCVIVWAAGNGREDVGNDGYARSDKVIAVAACNDRSKRSVYSDQGDAIWCAFPSNDFGHPPFGQPDPLTTGIWTTDRSGADGYNPGQTALGDAAGDYTNAFGGTSSACPGAAGVAALVLARNPSLKWHQVKDVLRRSCDQIDQADGQYDADGHSPFYGYGRLNAKKAVGLAQPAQPDYTAVHTAVQDVDIADLSTSRLAVEVGDTTPIQDLAVSVSIDHTFVGDLVVTIHGPGGSAVLHDRTGGDASNLNERYDQAGAPGLASLVGTNPQGTWTLEVSDNAKRDVGAIRKFAVELIY